MATISFWKLTGAGNDFVGLNNIEETLAVDSLPLLVKQLCHRRFGIGADGVLIIEPAPPHSTAHFKMRYFNADGSEAATCGNGARCIARLAHQLQVAPAEMYFDTLAGTYHAIVKKEAVIIDLPPVEKPQQDIELTTDEFSGKADFLLVGVPHLVLLCDDVTSIDVEKVGRSLRFHPQFQPAGTNVNFVQVINPHTIRIRTYERGVEAETLACGTGSLAASLALAVRNIVTPPVTVITHSGIKLQFEFVVQADKFSQIKMNGPADIVFSGTINLEHLSQIFPPSFF